MINSDIKKRIDAINNPDFIRFFFSLLKSIIKAAELSDIDERLALNVRSDKAKRFSVNINGRLVLAITDGNEIALMINSAYLETISEIPIIKFDVFEKQQPKSKLLYFDFNIIKQNIEILQPLWLKSCLEYLPVQTKSQYRKHHISDLYQIALDDSLLTDYLNTNTVNSISKLIENYKNLIKKTHLKDEVYKWELVKEFKGRPNLDAIGLLEEINSVKYGNLIYFNALTVLKRMVKEKPEEIRILLKMLFDESLDLSKRINDFDVEFLKIYRLKNGKHQHHQDERSIACYLTFYNPEKYTFYKHSYYKKLCELLNLKEAIKNEKYKHYLELTNKIVEDYIQEDSELIELVKNIIPSYYNGNNNLLLAQDILYQMLDKNEVDKNEVEKMNNIPLNQILYGPPGTGKTHKLKNDIFPKYTLTENSISPEAFFEDVVSTLTWWQVIALALLEIGTNKVNEILENRWVAKKAQLSESKNVRATIWGTLQMHTIVDSTTVNYTQRQTPFIFNKTEDKKWELIESDLKEQVPEIYDTLDSVNNFKPNPNKEIKHYVFITFHQSYSYEDFIEGIKPVMHEGQENVSYTIENGIFKELCLRAQNDPENRYAIFIDEINRGNVSQIFGELITLIEHDKRIGAKNEIRVKLPYSKKEFGVPMNVDIYGTMNTADRSVEALDTALRRRFSFEEMMPKGQVVADKNFTDYDRVTIMQKMNHRIELLLDRNYTLGHSYFLKKDFKNSFENEIIPLLQEYFYNDYGKIGLVLGKGFVREKEITKKSNSSIFADFETQNDLDIVKSFELIPFNEVLFDEALNFLLA